MSSLRCLGIRRGDVVSVVGAGGKTTLVYRLAAEARAAGMRVLVTTTTHMGTLPEATTGPVLVEEEGGRTAEVASALAAAGRATLLGRRIRADKLEGVAPERVDELCSAADLVLVEADGARGRSLKVPAAHEPVLPRSTSLVVVVAALDVLGEPLTDDRIHRLELVSAATGTTVGEAVDEDTVVSCLRHARGYVSRLPSGARAAVFLNKVEDPGRRAAALRIARRLVPPYGLVAAGSATGAAARIWP
ncbi:MAG TPA: selenium cofactor biosynthesis protein YqeC [Vicinamibacteria bacterium]|nr:selenium cofactor biosynthesis protein YqeC [Vicinamibacteria bacterium]